MIPPDAMTPAAAAAPWAVDPACMVAGAAPYVGPPPGEAAPEAVADSTPGASLISVGPGGAGVISVSGTIMPSGINPYYEAKGIATSCESVIAAVGILAGDEDVVGIVLRVHSPGGSVLGVEEAAAAVRAAAARKPVVAVASYFAASAAYWIASQAGMVCVSPSAAVGSVGVMSAAVVVRGVIEAQGGQVGLWTAGEGKADGSWLKPIDDAMDARMDDRNRQYYDPFVAAVASGRNVAEATVRDVWGARVMSGPAAVAAGMADSVAGFDGAARLAAGGPGSAAARIAAARDMLAAGRGKDHNAR